MDLTAFLSLPAEHVPAVLLVVGIVVTSCFFMLRKDTSKMPPLAKAGYFETMSTFMIGKNVPKFMLNNMREFGSVFRLNMPETVPWVVVSDSALARQILMEEDEKPLLYKRFDGFTANVTTLFSKRTHGDNWVASRKALANSFSMMNICTTLPKMYEKVEELKNMLLAYEQDGSTFEVSEITTRLTMDFICAAMFGVDYRTLQSENSPGRLLMDEFEKGLMEFALKQAFNPLRVLMFWDKDLRRAGQAAKTVKAAQMKILDNYRAINTPEEIEKDSSILAHIVRAPYRNDDERCADMTIFMVAGHDTTSYSMSWIIIEVARNPHVYAKLKVEIERIVPGDQTVTQKHLNEMTYLDDIIKEGMRLWPVAAIGSLREASKDIHYKDMIIPKGSYLNMCHYCLFRNGITDPDTFIPERWAASNTENEKLKEMYFPFALGKRNCIGQNLATLETKLVLASLYKSFRFELTTEVDSTYFLTLKPINAHFRVYSTK